MLTEKDKHDFDSDGIICLRGVLTAAEITKLTTCVDRQLSERATSATGYDFEGIARQIWASNDQIDVQRATRFDLEQMRRNVRSDRQARPLVEDAFEPEEGCFFYDVAAWQHDHGVREVAFDSALPALISELIDAKYLNFWEDTTFVKAPRSRQKTAFHQDLAYFQIAGDQCVFVWKMRKKSAFCDTGFFRDLFNPHRSVPFRRHNFLSCLKQPSSCGNCTFLDRVRHKQLNAKFR